MKQYNAIFISDVHMGTKHAQVDKLLTFLKETESVIFTLWAIS